MICARCNRTTIANSDYASSLTVPGVCWSCLTPNEQPAEHAAIERFTCDVCGGFREGNTCCSVEQPEDTYALTICYMRSSCALSLLALWDSPWSSNALRFANHALVRAYNAGCDVLEASGIHGWIR